MDRRRFLGSAALAAAALALPRRACPAARAPRPPSFLVVLADDLGYGDPGCYGGSPGAMPVLDRLASEGVRFSEFYALAPVCTPTRAALLTGCYPKRVGLHRGVLHPYSRIGLNPAETTLAGALRQQGYATGCFGKWHLGHHASLMPLRQGFDEFFGLPYSHNLTPAANPRYPPLPLFSGTEVIELDPDPAGLTARYTDAAIAFLRRHDERPFFLYLPHSMPHAPLAASAPYRGASGRGLYADVVAEIDASLGRLLEALDGLRRTTETLVLFTSDNGPGGPAGGSAGPLRGGKGTTWEGGVRVPAVARWPAGLVRGAECRAMATMMDLYPTFLALAGATPPSGPLDGRDLRRLLADPGGAPSPHEALAYYSRSGTAEALRSGPWKVHVAKKTATEVEEPGVELPALYDLDADPGERENLAARHPDRVSTLATRLREIDARLGREARPPGRVSRDAPRPGVPATGWTDERLSRDR